jgi:hypothetical protein
MSKYRDNRLVFSVTIWLRRRDASSRRGRARSALPGYAGGGNRFDLNHGTTLISKGFHDFLAEAAKRHRRRDSLFSSQYGEMQ